MIPDVILGLLRRFTPINDLLLYYVQSHCESDEGGRSNPHVAPHKFDLSDHVAADVS